MITKNKTTKIVKKCCNNSMLTTSKPPLDNHYVVYRNY